MIKLLCKKLHETAKLPVRNHETDSGADVFAIGSIVIHPGQTVVIKTGIAVQVWTDHIVGMDSLGGPIIDMDSCFYNKPGGWTFHVMAGHDKSGLGSKGLKVSAGVIDNPYTGEIGIVMSYMPTWMLWMNLIHLLKSLSFTKQIGEALTPQPYKFEKGDKIAQLIVQRVELPIIEEFEGEFEVTSRGTLGYGSSGK